MTTKKPSYPHIRHDRLLIALGVALLIAGCGASKSTDKAGDTAKVQQTAPKLAVGVATAAKTSWAQEVSLDADILSLAAPNIAAEVSGKIVQVLVEPGQSVKKGQVLVVVNPVDLALTASDASAQAAQIAAQLSDAQRSLKRNEDLAAKEFIGRATLEASQAQVAALEAQHRAYQARASLAAGNVAKSKVIAPFDAVVAQRNVAVGSYVKPGDIVASLWSASASTLRVRIPQEYSGKVTTGQKLRVKWGDKEVETALTHVRSDINADSRSFEAQASVPKELQTVTGASLSASLELGRDAVISVPAQAVQMAGSKATVFVVDKGNALSQKAVEVGRQKDGLVEIVKGLEEGEQVVVEGAAFARPGQKVDIRTASKAEGNVR